MDKEESRFAVKCTSFSEKECYLHFHVQCKRWKKKKGNLLFTPEAMQKFDWSNVPDCLEPLWAE